MSDKPYKIYKLEVLEWVEDGADEEPGYVYEYPESAPTATRSANAKNGSKADAPSAPPPPPASSPAAADADDELPAPPPPPPKFSPKARAENKRGLTAKLDSAAEAATRKIDLSMLDDTSTKLEGIEFEADDDEVAELPIESGDEIDEFAEEVLDAVDDAPTLELNLADMPEVAQAVADNEAEELEGVVELDLADDDDELPSSADDDGFEVEDLSDVEEVADLALSEDEEDEDVPELPDDIAPLPRTDDAAEPAKAKGKDSTKLRKEKDKAKADAAESDGKTGTGRVARGTGRLAGAPNARTATSKFNKRQAPGGAEGEGTAVVSPPVKKGITKFQYNLIVYGSIAAVVVSFAIAAIVTWPSSTGDSGGGAPVGEGTDVIGRQFANARTLAEVANKTSDSTLAVTTAYNALIEYYEALLKNYEVSGRDITKTRNTITEINRMANNVIRSKASANRNDPDLKTAQQKCDQLRARWEAIQVELEEQAGGAADKKLNEYLNLKDESMELMEDDPTQALAKGLEALTRFYEHVALKKRSNEEVSTAYRNAATTFENDLTKLGSLSASPAYAAFQKAKSAAQ